MSPATATTSLPAAAPDDAGSGRRPDDHVVVLFGAAGDLAARKLERVLTSDPGMGVIRHVDAGYERAAEVAAERGVRIPMTE